MSAATLLGPNLVTTMILNHESRLVPALLCKRKGMSWACQATIPRTFMGYPDRVTTWSSVGGRRRRDGSGPTRVGRRRCARPTCRNHTITIYQLSIDRLQGQSNYRLIYWLHDPHQESAHEEEGVDGDAAAAQHHFSPRQPRSRSCRTPVIELQFYTLSRRIPSQ